MIAPSLLRWRGRVARDLLRCQISCIFQRLPAATLAPEELNAAILLLDTLLDEQQRRLSACLESIKLGHGGARTLAAFLGLDPHTVAAGASNRAIKM